MDKIFELAFRKYTDETDEGEDFCGKIDDLFSPFLKKLESLVSEKDFIKLEEELIDVYIKAEVLSGVAGMKLMQNVEEKIA